MRLTLAILMAAGLGGCTGGIVLLAFSSLPEWVVGVGVVTAIWITFAGVASGGMFLEDTVTPTWAALVLIVLLLAVLLAACSPAYGAEIDMPLLRDTICHKEIRTMSAPYIGDGGESHGNCQMGIGTAHWIIPYAVKRGYVPHYMLSIRHNKEVLAAVMHVDFIAEGLADAYLEKIARRERTRDPLVLAYHYNGGHNSAFGAKPDAMAYAREVVILFKGPPKSSGPSFNRQKMLALAR